MEIENNKLDPSVESVKLIKNTKGYNWEIKIIGIDLERLKEINFKMMSEYGGSSND